MINNIIDDIIRREGGFVNHQNDTGGATNFGITQRTLEAYRNRKVSIEEIRNLSKEEAFKIYYSEYVKRPKFDLINDTLLQELVIDTGVHSGTHRATIFLQEVAGVEADGLIGPITIEAVNSKELFIPYFNKRMVFLAQLITRDNKQAVFAHGWYNRLSEFLLRYQKPAYNNILENWLNKLLVFFEK